MMLKKRYIDIYLSPYDLFNSNIFKSKLDVLDSNNRYSILFRVCFGSTTTFRMLGSQLAYNLEGVLDKSTYLDQLHDNILLRLETSMLNYNFSGEDIIAVQLLAYQVEYTDKVIKKIHDEFSLKKLGLSYDLSNMNISTLNLGYNKLLPPTMNLDEYKTKLETSSNNGLVTSILIKDKWVDFSNIIKDQNPYNKEIHEHLKTTNNFYINDNDKFIIIIDKSFTTNGLLQYKINIYTSYGFHIISVIDTYINKNTFSRSIGNITNTIDMDNKTTKNTTIKVKLDPINLKKDNKSLINLNISNPNIGTLDLETYVHKGISRVYALGFYTKNNVNTFYINPDTLDSNELILNCIDSMLTSKYTGYTFYVHNLGRYDVVFLLKTLINANITQNKYNLEIISRDNLILSLIIHKKVKTKPYTIKIVDSYNILSQSLKDLCKTYQSETDVSKDIFPYRFVNENTLFYKGDKPSINNYENLNANTYNDITNDWSTKEQTIKYLEKDLISLWQIINKFSDYIHLKYKIQVTNTLTISSLALKIFLSKYYNNNIPLITKRSIYEDIKLSYFGGITEVYRPTNINNETLYYYDVNSLYPYAALNIMPGLGCEYVSDINLELNNNLDIFGFYYCKIKTSNNYLGLLPLRSKEGIIMPNGEWEGWYFSEELKFSAMNGYKIFIIKGYNFSKEKNVFNNYVYDFYKIKSKTSDKVEKAVAKSLLNNLLGRLGLNIDKPTTSLVNKMKHNELQQTKKINNVIPIDDKFLVTYSNKVSKDICDGHNVDFKNTVLNNLRTKDESEHTFHDVSIAIASAVTSYARIEINKVKLDIINKGGNLYYSDTDSIVTNIPLEYKLIGNNIGQFKLEHTIYKAFFISNKTYLLKANNKTIIPISIYFNNVIKAKGVNNSNLNLKDFENLYKGVKINSQRTESYKDFSDGYVNINIKNILLDGDAYTKRLKVYENDKWIDTKPLTINKNPNN
jgi:hypothetical protein